jgi:cytochrome c oxidase subunit 1
MSASPAYMPEYALPAPDSARQSLARAWLWLGLLSLIGSGVFAVLLVLSRTPVLQNLFPVADFFHVALVAHVDLSVLVWFIAIAGMLWSINSATRSMTWGWVAMWGCALGVALMSLAPFIGRGEPIMANYIPVLSDPIFISGLLVFGAGFAALVLRSLVLAPVLGLSFNGDRKSTRLNSSH